MRNKQAALQHRDEAEANFAPQSVQPVERAKENAKANLIAERVAAWQVQADVIEAAPAQQTSRRLPWMARQLLKRLAALQWGQLRINFIPYGQQHCIKGKTPGPEAQLDIHDMATIWRIVSQGSVGFGEAYRDGLWDSPDLPGLIEVLTGNYAVLEGLYQGQALTVLPLQIVKWLKRNHKAQSRRNIAAHYDLGNDFYTQWLDQTMTYSSGLFATRPSFAAIATMSSNQAATLLNQAQQQKYQRIIDQLDIQPHNHILEIGCGWGGFACYAAETVGCQVTAITISQEQYDYAQALIKASGLVDRVNLQLQDYRDLSGQFDQIVSIEMIEAVGEAYWPVYFQKIQQSLKPTGQALLQVITIDDAIFPSYRKDTNFIAHAIFPGGMLLAPQMLQQQAKTAQLSMTEQYAFGQDYAVTLALWRRRFMASWPQIRQLDFDPSFKRLWDFYLSCCEGAFRSGHVDVYQIRLNHADEGAAI